MREVALVTRAAGIGVVEEEGPLPLGPRIWVLTQPFGLFELALLSLLPQLVHRWP